MQPKSEHDKTVAGHHGLTERRSSMKRKAETDCHNDFFEETLKQREGEAAKNY
jgi:hypothetical protein